MIAAWIWLSILLVLGVAIGLLFQARDFWRRMREKNE